MRLIVSGIYIVDPYVEIFVDGGGDNRGAAPHLPGVLDGHFIEQKMAFYSTY